MTPSGTILSARISHDLAATKTTKFNRTDELMNNDFMEAQMFIIRDLYEKTLFKIKDLEFQLETERLQHKKAQAHFQDEIKFQYEFYKQKIKEMELKDGTSERVKE